MSIPEVFFRETIDLNRYSNAVSKDFVQTYNDVILTAAKKLKQIDIRQAEAGAGVVISPQTRKRLRAIIQQSKISLDMWRRETSKKMINEIEGLAKVQSGFIENELKKVVKSGSVPINSVAISEKYAKSFVTTDPTRTNIFTSKEFTEDDFAKFGSGKFELTARQGAMQTLPNGQTVEKAFRGIAENQKDALTRHIRQGVFSGESTQQIARRMIGRLDFSQKGSVRQIAQAGGELTKLANHQIQTIVRTSVNQVQNQASQAVYAANSKVAPKYEYVATLDSRTSPICKRLDGRKFAYNKGPTPPQHFNCRSTTVPVVDYAGLKKQKGFEDLTPPPKGKVVTRPTGEGTGRVPQDTQYGDWLLGQDKKLKVKTLGNEQKVRYFERLAKKEGSGQKAIRKMVREDGSERSLKDLERLYGKPSAIKPKAKPRPKPKPVDEIRSSQVISTPSLDEYLKTNKIAKSSQEFVDDSIDSIEALGGKVAVNTKKMKQYLKKSGTINNVNMMGDRWNYDEAFERIVVKNRKAFDLANKTTEKTYKLYDAAYVSKSRQGIGYTISAFDQPVKSGAFFRNEFKFVFTPAGRGNLGYTSKYCSVVNTSVTASKGALKVTKTAAKDMKKTAERVLENSFNRNLKQRGLPFKGDPKRVAWTTGNEVDGKFDWINTMIHEIGHQIHFKGNGGAALGQKFKKMGGINFVTEYSQKNPQELFAESFVQYILNPEGMEKYAPRLYNWVEETVDNALKVL